MLVVMPLVPMRSYTLSLINQTLIHYEEISSSARERHGRCPSLNRFLLGDIELVWYDFIGQAGFSMGIVLIHSALIFVRPLGLIVHDTVLYLRAAFAC